MKKIKKFDDGGPTGGRPIGGRYVDSGDGQIFVPDTPDTTPSPVAAGLAPVRGRPMSGGIAGIQAPIPTADAVGGFQDIPVSQPARYNAGSTAGGNPADGLDMGSGNSRPIGQLMPPPNRRMSVPGAVPGTYAEMARGMGGMKKGGTVKKTTKVVKAKTATVRGHGIEQRGKTKGRFV